jgi:importin subunit alpha-2
MDRDNLKKLFKNRGKDSDELRRRRKDDHVHLRKDRQQKDFLKRRCMDTPGTAEDELLPKPDAATIQCTLEMVNRYIHSDHKSEELQGLQIAGKMIDWSTHPDLIPEVINSGLVPKIIEFLHCRDDDLLFAAVTFMVNITAGKVENPSRYVIDHGIINGLYAALQNSEDYDIRGRSFWALGNLMNELGEVRDKVVADGIVNALILFGQQPLPAIRGRKAAIETMKCICWTSAQVLSGPPWPDSETVEKLLPLVCSFFELNDPMMNEYWVTALVYIFRRDKNSLSEILKWNPRIIPRLVSLLNAPDLETVRSALSLICGISVRASDDQVLLELVTCDSFLCSLKSLLSNRDTRIVKNATYLLGDIIYETTPENVVAEVYNLGIVSVLAQLIKMDTSAKYPLLVALVNIASVSSLEQTMWLCSEGIHRYFCEKLKSKYPTSIRDAMDGIELMLKKSLPDREGHATIKQGIEECRGLETIELLQSYQNDEIAKSASIIIDSFFRDEGSEMDFLDSMDSIDCMTSEPVAGPSRANTTLPPLQLCPNSSSTFQAPGLPFPFLTVGSNPSGMLPSPFLMPNQSQGQFVFTPIDPTQHFSFDNPNNN